MITNLTVGYQLETLSPQHRLQYYGGRRGLRVGGGTKKLYSV